MYEMYQLDGQGETLMPRKKWYDLPYYDVYTVLERLMIIYNNFKSEEMNRTFVAESINMSPKGGAFSMLISSIEKYGFIQTEYGGKLALTDLAKEALVGNEFEKNEAIRKAFLNVELFNRIYTKFGAGATEDQFKAFLRQEAELDIIQAHKKTQTGYKLYRIFFDEFVPLKGATEEQLDLSVIEADNETDIEPVEKIGALIIKYEGVYIRIPADDLDSIIMAKNALKLMEDRIKNKI